MFGTSTLGEPILLIALWLIPFVAAYWVLRTLVRISHNLERVANAVEKIALNNARDGS